MIFRTCLLLSIIFIGANFVISQDDTRRVAIIGGGIAGVSSAYYISQYDQQATITVFEKESELGGNAITVDVKNAKGELVKVDMGPQYFAEGPWDDYIRFVRDALGMDTIQSESMVGTLLIQQEGNQTPTLITPLNGDFRDEKIGKLLKLKKFNNAAYKVYKNPERWEGVSIESWVNELPFEFVFKEEIIYPFLAASLGTSIQEIKGCSAVDIVKLFAFRKPKASNTFDIMDIGMGTLIREIGFKLEKKGVRLAFNSPVVSVKKVGERYEVVFEYNGERVAEMFDFVVFSVHADQLFKLLNQTETQFDDIKEPLEQMNYFEARIVLHKDSSLVNTQKPAFLNIITSAENELVYTTMNLSLISDRFCGIYKSWLTSEQVEKVKSNGTFMKESTFYHPLINTTFVAQLEVLNEIAKKYKSLSIIGGWSQGLETQNSAVLSGLRSLEVYKTCFNLD